ncbi:MAG: hypothetical protein JWO36_1436 [Myxococcales bacterium]|nr:hypothetical protein [Myxococcales bacterium]
MLLAIATLVTACYPASRASTTVSRTLSDPILDRTGRVALRSEVLDGTVVVRSTWPRQCHRDVTEVVKETTGHEMDLITDNPAGGLGLMLGMLVLYPVGIADVVITGVVAIADPKTTKLTTRPAGSINVECSISATHVPVHLTLPSGTVVDGATDDAGRFAFVLPEGEKHGRLKVRADDIDPAGGVAQRAEKIEQISASTAAPPAEPAPDLADSITDSQLLSTINTVRARVVACGPRFGVAGIISVRMTISPAGRVREFYPRNNAAKNLAFTGCVGNALSAATFPPSKNGSQAVLAFNLDDVPPPTAVAVAPPAPQPAPVPPMAAKPTTPTTRTPAATPTTPAALPTQTTATPQPPPPPVSPPQSPESHAASPEPRDPNLKLLVEKARNAAVTGRCPTVKAFAHAIKDKEPEYYARVFSVDPPIAACLK